MMSMKSRLRADFMRSVKQGNQGHRVGFYRREEEIIPDAFAFKWFFGDGEHIGLYQIRVFKRRHSGEGDFVWWDYCEAEEVPPRPGVEEYEIN